MLGAPPHVDGAAFGVNWRAGWVSGEPGHIFDPAGIKRAIY